MEKTQATTQQNTNTTKKPSTARAVFAGIFGVIAMLFFIPAVLSIWLNITFLSSDNFSNSVTTIIVNPKISKQIAQMLSDSIITDDTVGDLSQSILTPEQANQAPEEVKNTLKQVFNDSLVQIIGSKNVQATAKDLIKKFHVVLIASPPKGAQSATLDFRPFITAVINGANGTKIAIITSKFALEEGQGVVDIKGDQYNVLQNGLNLAKTTMIVQISVFLVGSILAIAIANRRFRAMRRLLLTSGILLVIFGLPIFLIPMILASSTQADIAATFTGARILIEPLSITMLVIGGLLIVGVIIANIITKVSSKNTAKVATQTNTIKATPKTVAKPQPKKSPVKPTKK